MTLELGLRATSRYAVIHADTPVAVGSWEVSVLATRESAPSPSGQQ